MESSTLYHQSRSNNRKEKRSTQDLKQKLFQTQQKLREEAAQSHTPTRAIRNIEPHSPNHCHNPTRSSLTFSHAK